MEFKLVIDLASDVKKLLAKLIDTGFSDSADYQQPQQPGPQEHTVSVSESVSVQETKPAKVKKEKQAAVPDPTNGVKKWTLEEVRAKATDISNVGPDHLANVKALIKKHGAPKLTELKETDYPAFMAELEAMNPIKAPKTEETL